MLMISGTAISIHRGDTDAIEIKLKNKGTGEPLELTAEDTVTFAVKPKLGGDVVFSKDIHIVGSVVTIPLTSCDTDLPPKTYQWGIRIKFANGRRHTPMNPADFTVLPIVPDTGGD